MCICPDEVKAVAPGDEDVDGFSAITALVVTFYGSLEYPCDDYLQFYNNSQVRHYYHSKKQ